MIEHDASISLQLARERAEHLAEEYRRAQRPRAARRHAEIRHRIASLTAIARRRRAGAHDPAYRH